MTTVETFRVSDGRVSAIHRMVPAASVTLCGRNAAGITPMPTDPWAAMGWRAASAGVCQRCAARA
jgi:hypothetical protein